MSKSYPIFKKGDLQNNLDIFNKMFVKNNYCKIKYKKFTLNIYFKKIKESSDKMYYIMIYDTKNRYSGLYPIKIYFIDPLNYELNNNTYISNIHKTTIFSGTEIVKLSLLINKKLGALKTTLGDGTKITCGDHNFDLSYIKLIEKKTTFYTNLGFDFEVNTNVFMPFKFNDKNKLKKEVNKLIEIIRKIKISDIILECKNILYLLYKVVITNNKYNLKIYISESTPYHKNIYLKKNPMNKINDIFNFYKNLLEILYKYKNQNYFYKILIKLFKENKCEEYKILNDYIFDNTYLIEYNKKKIIRKNCDTYHFLKVYRSWYLYSYYFI